MNTTFENLTQDKTVRQIKPKIFLCDQLHIIGKTDAEDIYYSIEEIVDMWGYKAHFDEMINHFQRFIDNNPDILITVHYDCGGFNKEMEHQKLLGWSIWDMRQQKFGLVGGVLFQNNEMSFHT